MTEKLANDYFNYKNKVTVDRQRIIDQIELARVENQALKEQIDKTIVAEKLDGEYSEEMFERKTEQFASRFRKQAKKHEQDLNVVKV